MEPTNLDALKAINPQAHQEALDIIAECGCPEEGDVVTPDQFEVTIHPLGYYMLAWCDYGPFNPVPTWIWDPDASEWVSNDDIDAMERYQALEEKHYQA